jgi:hypothetical protein
MAKSSLSVAGFANRQATTRGHGLRCFGRAQSETVYLTAVMQQVEQGKQSRRRVNQYLDQNSPTKAKSITPKHHDAHRGFRGAGQGPDHDQASRTFRMTSC